MGLGFLLDTNALLWSLMEPGKLSPKALALVKDSDTRLVVSSASAWEVSIKYHLGKLSGAEAVIENFSGHLERLQADVLSITPAHALAAGALPRHHRDPFDRMLIAQARLERLPLISSDGVFEDYDVETLW